MSIRMNTSKYQANLKPVDKSGIRITVVKAHYTIRTLFAPTPTDVSRQLVPRPADASRPEPDPPEHWTCPGASDNLWTIQVGFEQWVAVEREPCATPGSCTCLVRHIESPDAAGRVIPCWKVATPVFSCPTTPLRYRFSCLHGTCRSLTGMIGHADVPNSTRQPAGHSRTKMICTQRVDTL